LDTITENSIQEALQTLSENRTVVVIAHRLSTIRHAQQIIVLDEGKIIEKGTHEQLLSNPDSQYSQMWLMQSKYGANEAK
jgi:ABC-type multidrug transport system fused ATPase/permease subunit